MRTSRFGLTLLFLAGCAVNPVTGRHDFVLVSTEKEKEIGKQAAAEIAAEMGIYEEASLESYVRAVGERLAAHSPRRDIDYEFHVADVEEPNAFTLPGGHIYVTRGLLVLVNSEDELACVIGHEIGHGAARHSVQQISRQAPLNIVTGITSGVVGLASPLLGSLVGGAGQLASGLVLAPYSRDQEREADRIGQQLAAEGGWDPAAMATFLRTLQRYEALRGESGWQFRFFGSHPSTPERVESTAANAADFRRADIAPLSPSRTAFLQHFDGLPTGVNVANGYFDGRNFIQPDLGVFLTFPEGWRQRNLHKATVAAAPDGGAVITLSIAAKSDDPLDGARAMAREVGDALLRRTESTTVGSLRAAHAVFHARGDRGEIDVDITWIAYRGSVFELVCLTSPGNLAALQKPLLGVRKSFRPLTAAERAGVREDRLRLVNAGRGETPEEVVARSASAWNAAMFAVANGVSAGQALAAGETVKITAAEKYH